MIFYQNSIVNFFNEILNELECQYDTRAYIVGIYGKYKNAEFDLSKDSLTLAFAQARNKQDFFTYQNIGDYIFFINTLAPEYFQNASKEYYDTIARLSYYSCYKIVNKQLKFYEEMSDNFNYLEKQVKNRLPKLF